MISLKKTIEAFDHRAMGEAAFHSYRSAIDSLDRSTVGIDHDGLDEFRSKLAQLRDRLAANEIEPALLRQHALDLDDAMAFYRSELEMLLKESNNDLKEVVSVLADAAESLSQRENLHSGQLSRISGSLESLARFDDVTQMRNTLNREVHELRTCILQMSKDSEGAIASLQREIAGFQTRLEKIQIEASTDPLTGAANRRRCTREIVARARTRDCFGILLFDLNRFKQINDTHGHGAGDSVLRIVAQRLAGQVRKDDLVCRWGGDEFAVVQNGSGEELLARGKDIVKRISGKVKITADGVDRELSIGAEFGWAEHQEKDTVEGLFSRADKVLYDTKARRLKIAGSANPSCDRTTGLPCIEAAENALKQIQVDQESWFIGCFVIRSAAKVNGHYGFAAAEEVLPFLRDELRSSKFGPQLFRGRGASILALVQLREGAQVLEREIRRVCLNSMEKHLGQARKASSLPIAPGGKLIPVSGGSALKQVNEFIDKQHGDPHSSMAPRRA